MKKHIKKLLLCAQLLGMLPIAVLPSAAAATPDEYILYPLNTQANITSFVSKTHGMDISHENGFMKFATSNNDPSFTHIFTSDVFIADEYPYVKYRYRFDKVENTEGPPLQGQIFFHTDSSPKMGSSGSGTYCYFDITADGEWHSIVVDMTKIPSSSWNGNIDTFRIDPVAFPNDITYTGQVDYIGFFQNEEEANLYVSDAQKDYEKKHIPASEVLINTVEKKGVRVILTKDSGISKTTPQDRYIMPSPDLTAGDTVSLVKDDNISILLPLSVNTGSEYVYVAKGTGNYVPSSHSVEFNDTKRHWAREYIDFAAARAVFSSTETHKFCPEDTVTRGMYITLLGKMHGIDITDYTEKTYDDVQDSQISAPYIQWAVECGILTGDMTNFRPEDPINRVEMADITADYIKAYGYTLAGTGLMAEFKDTENVDIHSIGAITMLQRLGIVNGRTTTTFAPFENLTRAEAAAVITRLIKSILGIHESVEEINQTDSTAENDDVQKGNTAGSWNIVQSEVDTAIHTNGLKSYYPYQENKLLIGAYDVNINSEADVKLLVEAGLNLAITTYTSVSHRNNILKWCWQYDIDVIFFDRKFTEPYEPKFATAYDGTAEMPNYLGSSTTDEPGASKYPELRKITDALKTYAPDKYSYMNLFPNYASARQFEGYPLGLADNEKAAYDAVHKATMTYREYLETFAAEIPSNNILSADIYPFLWSGNKKVTRSQYMQGLAELGDVARKNEMRLAIIMQAVNYASVVRQPSEQDIRFQAYSSMAFGATMMSYYTYKTRGYETVGRGMLDREGHPTTTFYNAQPVNFELQRISDPLMNYKNLGAFTVNASQASHPYLYFQEQYDDPTVIPELHTTEPVLVGCFAKKEGKGHAYMFVNGTDIQKNASIDILFRLPSSGEVTLYNFGTPSKLTSDKNGFYRISLECGQGVLVTVNDQKGTLHE